MIKGTLPSQEAYVEKPKRFSMVANGFQRPCALPLHARGGFPCSDKVLCEHTVLHCTARGKELAKKAKTKTMLYIFDAFEKKKKIISFLAFKQNSRAQIFFS